MKNKINFVKTYTLSELFSGERRIIIPDLQRDYCWGGKKDNITNELVSGFINNLIEQYNQNQDSLNLGLFYGYEVPANHIQLCDGQQRLTTLYLLLGMLNKRCGRFQQNLISDYEYIHDDKEPYLNYAIRESSLYFLSDLVCKFFINNKDKVETIIKSEWYFNDYNLDPSIQSMINALSIIEPMLNDKDESWIKGFGGWLLNKLTFLYFDMENRKNGEETFVIINTTGEPLSATQNLKPLVIQEKNDTFDNTNFTTQEPNGTKLNVAGCWEQIETWFWRNRNESVNDTADAGFEEFLRWVYMIELSNEEHTSKVNLIQKVLQGKGKMDFPYKYISFKKVYKYWRSLTWIYGDDSGLAFSTDNNKKNYLSPKTNTNVNDKKAIGQNDCFVLLPVLKYVYCKLNIDHCITDEQKRNVRRVYEFFRNLIHVDHVSKNVNTLVDEALKIIDLIDDSGDIVSVLNKKTECSNNKLLTEEERSKLSILKANADKREQIEESFWKAQNYDCKCHEICCKCHEICCERHEICCKCHEIWSGEIMPLIKWASDDDGFHIDLFNKYVEVFDKTFKEDCDAKIDIVRRALLTRGLTGYPRIFSGNTVYSFAWEWSDWHVLINDNQEKFKEFFDELPNGTTDEIYKICEQMIENDSQNTEWWDFVHDDRLMAYCEQKKLQKPNGVWYLMKNTTMRGEHVNVNAYKYYLHVQDAQKKDKSKFSGWKDVKCSEDTLQFVQPYVEVHITWNAGDNHKQIKIDLSMCQTDKAETKQKLQPIAEDLGFQWKDNYYAKSIDIIGTEYDEIDKLLNKTCEYNTNHPK